MALDTRLIGQALGEGKPIDLASAVRPAAIRGERAFARTAAIKQQKEKELKAENQRRESLQARAISQLQDIDQTKVPAQIRDYITNKAFGLKQAALAVIQDKSIDPITAQLEIQKYMGEINNLSAKSNDFKEWQKLFIDTDKNDLSNLNTPEIISKVNDIQDGAMQLQENGMFKFKDGSEYSFDDMLKIRHVNKRSDSYMKALGAFEKLGLQSGLKGNSIGIFKTNADSEFKQLELTDADYASIAVDYLGMDAGTSLGAKIKADFESDGDFDDSDLKQEVYNFVKNHFINAAETTYSEGNKEYQSKVSIETPDPTEADKKRAITYDNAFRKSTDISKFKKELGIPTNEAGIAIGDPQSIEPKAKLDITSDNFSNLVNKLGFRVSAIYRADKDDANSEIQSIELKEQGGTGVYEVVPGQSSMQFLKGIFRMQGVNERDLPSLINNVLYGTFKIPENDKYSQYIKK